MSARYQKLLEAWREAAAATRHAQGELKARFDLFLQGLGPEPAPEELARVQALREVESARLQAALAYVRQTAIGDRK